MTRTELRDYVNDKPSLLNYTPTEVRVNGKDTYICPLCGHGNNGDGICSYKSGWKCFSCGEYGNITHYYAKEHSLDDTPGGFVDLMDHIAKAVNVTIENSRPSAAYDFKGIGTTQNGTTAPRPDAPERDFSNLFNQAASQIDTCDYLDRRGISKELQKKFNIGYMQASDGYPERIIIPTSAGSFVQRDITPGATARYKNIGHAHLFNSDALTGSEPVIVTEGAVDAMSVIQAGGQAVALNSINNCELLIAFIKTLQAAPRLVLWLDNDERGQKAEKELSDSLNKMGIPFVTYKQPTGKDPNDALLADPDALRSCVLSLIGQASQLDVSAINPAQSAQDAPQTANTNDRVNTFINGSDALTAFLNRVQRSDFKPITTGFKQLDEKLGGGLYSGLCIVSGAPSEGKTTFAAQIAEHIADKEKRPILIFSFEMSREQLIARSLSRLSYDLNKAVGIASEAAVTALEALKGNMWDNLSKAKQGAIQAAQNAWKSYASRIYILDNCQPSIETVIETAELFIQTTGTVPVLMLDYLQLFEMRGSETLANGLGRVTRSLKQFATNHDTNVILISSVNRQAQKAGAADNMATAYGSSFAEYSADCLLALDFTSVLNNSKCDKNTEKQKPIRDMTVTIQKNRMGESGAAIRFDYPAAYNVFFEANQPGCLVASQAGKGKSY